jgi:hypothetical protein
MSTKAAEIYQRVNELVATGSTKPDAFRTIAEERGIAYDSVRGAFYGESRKQSGQPTRTRRRETTADDAVASAVKALQNGITAIDREIEQADARAREAAEEAKAIKASAPERKAAIQAKLEALS